ncbi:hypothetical protein FOA52_011174 [Chlamydomonas sp. UWO 241]|nr:hypothetical protein FOA52_011174 [Chlamydomonas sp. UWO 241]
MLASRVAWGGHRSAGHLRAGAGSTSGWACCRPQLQKCCGSGGSGSHPSASSAERSDLVAEETVYLMFQLDLDVQLQRCLNQDAYERAQDVRSKRHKLDEAIAAMQERKSAKLGTSASGGPSTLTFTDYAAEGLRLRSEMLRAVEGERYKEAAQFKSLLSELEKESKRVQSASSESPSSVPRLRLGQRVLHATQGFRALVVGFDLQCCESDVWVAAAGVEGKVQQPFYHVLVDERDWSMDMDTGMPPVAYVAEELLTCPEIGSPPLSWVEAHGDDAFEHAFSSVLFLGADGRGDYIPCRHLRNKFNVQRRDVYKPGEDPMSGSGSA